MQTCYRWTGFLFVCFSLAGSLPLSVNSLSPRVQEIYRKVVKFIEEHVRPFELEVLEWQRTLTGKDRWTIHPKLDELKVRILNEL